MHASPLTTADARLAANGPRKNYSRRKHAVYATLLHHCQAMLPLASGEDLLPGRDTKTLYM
eukprot:9822365-Alexandrium_andersonii.AAC.1